MAYFVITHPRSGSSALCIALSQSNQAWNLDEFFHVGCTQLWGDARKLEKKIIEKGTVLEIFYNFQKKINCETFYSSKIRNEICRSRLLDSDEFTCWKEEELLKRFEFLEKLNLEKQQYVVKIFIDSPYWVDYKFASDRSVILYRKDFLDSIFSILIKNHFKNFLSEKNFFIDEYKGGLMNVPNFTFSIDYETFHGTTNYFFNFLRFCRDNKNINRISYEDLYNGSIDIRLFDQNYNRDKLTFIERKMQYYKDKIQYIRNHKEIYRWYTERIEKENLNEICDILKIDLNKII